MADSCCYMVLCNINVLCAHNMDLHKLKQHEKSSSFFCVYIGKGEGFMHSVCMSRVRVGQWHRTKHILYANKNDVGM